MGGLLITAAVNVTITPEVYHMCETMQCTQYTYELMVTVAVNVTIMSEVYRLSFTHFRGEC